MSEKDHIVDQPCTDGDESTKNKSVGYETTIQSSDATTVKPYKHMRALVSNLSNHGASNCYITLAKN